MASLVAVMPLVEMLVPEPSNVQTMRKPLVVTRILVAVVQHLVALFPMLATMTLQSATPPRQVSFSFSVALPK